MSEITSEQSPHLAKVFDTCPEPCAILEGDAIVASNPAFRAQFQDAASWRSCIAATDQDELATKGGASYKFVARPAMGFHLGQRMQWTAWSVNERSVCVRLDGPASPEIPPAFERELGQAHALLRAVAELPVTVWAMNADGMCTLSLGKGLQHFGLKSGQLVGQNLLQVYPSDSETHHDIRRALQGESIAREIRIGDMTWYSTLLPIHDALGQKVAQVYGVAENVTERSQAQRHIEEQLLLIKSQQETLAALTSPIIEVWQGVLVVPLIGSLDEHRAGRLMEHLLAAVIHRQSRAVILDLTGAPLIDSTTAQYLFDIMRSVRLLGAEGLVSGIRPNVARTMVELDIAGTSWTTFTTLAEALRRILGKRLSTK